MTTQWRKMESWEPCVDVTKDAMSWRVHKSDTGELLGSPSRKFRRFKSRAVALRAANKQNDLEGLPRVS